jgi:hypothetical protein
MCLARLPKKVGIRALNVRNLDWALRKGYPLCIDILKCTAPASFVGWCNSSEVDLATELGFSPFDVHVCCSTRIGQAS